MEIQTAIQIDALHMDYRELSQQLKAAIDEGARDVTIVNVCGQRYIGTGVRGLAHISIYGIPGNDLGSFMQGPTIHVYGNAQDGCGNTLDGGALVIHGHAGDIVGYSMRGGKIMVRDGVGYRAAIHMKEYQDRLPVLVIGGQAQPFLGEYMAGGKVVVLALKADDPEYRCAANFIGTGMHGGTIYVRGKVKRAQLGQEVDAVPVDDPEAEGLGELVREYCQHFGGDPAEILAIPFTRIYPRYLRPYGRLYAY
ncbi:MAG: hypothetical protein GXY76_08165 [Chloroflexi bacterium]|nr:hypothetical protein [Chloroflexota bacterium]